MPELDPELAALSAALGALAPAPPALDRDRLFFEAGRRATRPPARAWPLAACGFAALAVALGLRLATAPVPAPIERIVVMTAPASRRAPAERVGERPEFVSPVVQRPASGYPAGSPDSFVLHPTDAPYLRLRDQVLRFGADTLPDLPATRPEPPAAPVRLRGVSDGGMPSPWFLPIS